MHKRFHHIYDIAIICMMVAMFVFSACSPSHKGEVDELNYLSYALHYRNLDSTKVLAEKALALSEDYPAGYAEACNNLAFVAIAKMDYHTAKRWLDKVNKRSDNQIELLIADVQNMRLCQREARNKDFYSFREKAIRKLRRIGEEIDNLPLRERHHFLLYPDHPYPRRGGILPVHRSALLCPDPHSGGLYPPEPALCALCLGRRGRRGLLRLLPGYGIPAGQRGLAGVFLQAGALAHTGLDGPRGGDPGQYAGGYPADPGGLVCQYHPRDTGDQTRQTTDAVQLSFDRCNRCM